MTEIKVIIKDFPVDKDDSKAMKKFYQEPYEVFINGEKQTDVQ